MREIAVSDLTSIYGGADAPIQSPATMALNACKGMPDSAKVTVALGANGQVGIGSTSTGTTASSTVEVLCGDMRSYTPKAPSRSASGVVTGSAGSSYEFAGWSGGEAPPSGLFTEGSATDFAYA